MYKFDDLTFYILIMIILAVTLIILFTMMVERVLTLYSRFRAVRHTKKTASTKIRFWQAWRITDV